ncbi:MAG: hypothetical protein GY827_04155 [Cytophagales bacterium]|nr:hypothetical protein [Cytophagales bacterium]
MIEAPDVTPVRKGTGIGIVDAEIDKLREEKETKRKETIDQYNIERGVFEEKKADYKNFDQVNSKIE